MKREWVTAWLASAANDLIIGEADLGVSMSSYETASFHAQQAAEKSLKALLIRHQVEFDKTHNVQELLRLAEPVAVAIADRLGDARDLTPYAVAARYPGFPPVEKDEAARHLTLARTVLDTIRALLQTYLDEPDTKASA